MKLKTHDKIQLTAEELTMPLPEALQLPWIRAGVARLRTTRLGYELEIGPYAGTLALGDVLIEVAELVPGTVAACLHLSATGRRFGEQWSQRARTVSPSAAVARAYTDSLTTALGQGVSKEYVDICAVTSRPRGKVLVGATVTGPWARGRTREVVAKWRPLTENTPVNRVLLAAGVRAQHLFGDEQSTSLRQLRECLIALSGAALQNNPAIPAEQTNADPNISRTLALARSLLEGVPVVPEGNDEDGGAFSAWINVERVFEEAILSICKRLHPGSTYVGSSLGVELFSSRAGEEPHRSKRADPDIVLRLPELTIVIDAKYRRSGENPSEEELYQLIAHAGAFDAQAAALIAPAMTGCPGIVRLGRVQSGCTIDIIAVDPTETKRTEKMIRDWVSAQELSASRER
ncbi:MAG: 5-methylcytosine restriction system specificity protein McrC [Rhodococcus qingshengii]